jgi:hypothetical protein
MAAPQPTEQSINVSAAETTQQGLWCYLDATRRSSDTVAANPVFFNDDHLRRVNAARMIVDRFFPVKSDIYINHRAGKKGTSPFTVVKVFGIGQWPTGKNKQKDLYQPLADLGVTEVVLPKSSNSYIFRITR